MKIKITKKTILIYLASTIFLLIVLPATLLRLFPGLGSITDDSFDKVSIPKSINLFLTKTETTTTIDFEEYIKGVVAAEMPDSFHLEALKAQAVASRTYALGKVLAGDKICDSTHCQAYSNTNISTKVAKAVEATRGQLLYYNNSLAAHTLYFSSSGGRTENSEDVFSSECPYLRGVKSKFENGATHQKEAKSFTISEFSTKIKDRFPTKVFKEINKSNIKILARSKGGRVTQIKVGDQIISGTDLRSALSLSSTLFTIKTTTSKVTITTNGYGHGVGMSQYGANGYAEKGYSYQEILAHYYKGTQVH